MPVAPTYPGVYIEEIPSGVRTITGVSTSDTAFIDFFKKGPLDDPVRITSFGDFERLFGGLDSRSAASYAIQQYYLNGGSVAYIVRVAERDSNGLPVAGTATLTATGGALDVLASSPGAWANKGIRVSVPTGAASGFFNLKVEAVQGNDPNPTVSKTENYFNLSMDPNNARYAPNLVNNNSTLVRLSHTDKTNTTAPTGVPASPNNRLDGGTDGTAPGDSAGNWSNTLGGPALTGSPTAKTGIYALENIAPYVFNLLCLPGAVDLSSSNMDAIYQAALSYVESKRAFLLIDIPANTTLDVMDTYLTDHGLNSKNAAIYFPRLMIADPLQANTAREMAASGTLAGIYARIDAQRGVWKAPAGTEAALRNARVALKVSDGENGGLNPLGVNALRNFPIYGDVVWGSRTIMGNDQQASEWKYIPVRRIALYIEESLYRGTQWVVFEPNDEPLWAQIRLNVGAFMHTLFRQGAFQGSSPREAYFVKCDKETTTQDDINRGVVNVLVGFAPLKPAEFVIIQIQQIAGQIQV